MIIVVLAAFTIYWLRIRPTSVIGYPVSTGEIAAEVMATGTLEAEIQTVVSTKIPGRIDDMQADKGDRV